MQANLIMMQKEDLQEAFNAMLEDFLSRHQLVEMPSQDEDKYLSSDEACDYLHVTQSTLWRMRQRGDIIAHKVGGRRLYSKNDLDALVTNG